MSIAPDGKTFALGSEAGKVEIRTIQGVLLKTIQGPVFRMGEIWALAFSPDGRQLLVAGNETDVELLDLEETDERRTFRLTEEDIFSIAFSPDGSEVLMGGIDGIARRHDLQGNVLMEYKVDSDQTVNAVRFSPDGRYILVARGAKVYVWDLEGKLISTLEGHEFDIVDLAISPDGQYLLTGSYDKTAKLWSKDGKLLKTLEWHTSSVNVVGFLQTCDNCELKLLTAGLDQLVVIWDLNGQPKERLGGHQSEVRSVSFHPDGGIMATAGGDHQILLWDQQGHLLQRMSGHKGIVKSIAFSPDGAWLLSGSLDHTVKLWDRNGRLVRTFPEHDNGITRVQFFPDGQSLLSVAGSELHRWDLGGNLLLKYDVPFNIVGLDIAGDGTQIVLTGGGGLVLRLSSGGKLLGQFQNDQDNVYYDVAFSPDGSKILLGSTDGQVSLLDLEGQIIRQFNGLSGSVYKVAFSPECSSCPYEAGQVIAASAQNSIILWDRQGQEVQRFSTGTGTVTDFKFAPDGKSLLAGRDDQIATRFENLEAYFGDSRNIAYSESVAYALPFDYRAVEHPGLILDFGLRYLQLNNSRARSNPTEINLPTLDSARQVMEFLVDRFGDGYRVYLSEVLYNNARYYFRKGAFVEAIAAYEKVISFEPSDTWIHLELATTLLFAGDWERTKAIYDQWLGKKWDLSVSLYARSWDEAFYKYLQRASEMVPPKDAGLVKKAEQYLLEAMSK